jgi:drug/metabolite transporter (DMT)-like permease
MSYQDRESQKNFNMGSNSKGALIGLAAFAIYATHDAIVKYLGASYTPFQILFFSVLLGFPLISLMLVRDKSAENMRPNHPWWTVLRTVSILISSVCVFYSFSVLPLAQTYSILFTLPLFTTLLSIPVLGERVGIHRGGAVVIGLIGVLIVIRPDGTELSLGHVAAFAGAFFASLAAIIVRRIGRDERNVVLVMFPMLGSFLVMGVLMLPDYRPMPLEDFTAVAALALLGFVALNLMIAAYKTAEAVVVAPMQYSQIVWAILFGMIFFDEIPDIATLVGAVIIIASGIYIVLREGRKNVSMNTPVLRSRSRISAGNFIPLGPILRLVRKRDDNKL